MSQAVFIDLLGVLNTAHTHASAPGTVRDQNPEFGVHAQGSSSGSRSPNHSMKDVIFDTGFGVGVRNRNQVAKCVVERTLGGHRGAIRRILAHALQGRALRSEVERERTRSQIGTESERD